MSDKYSGSMADKFRKAMGGSELDNPQPEAQPGLQHGPPPAKPEAVQAMEQWERVEKSRAARGLPSLPKPGSKESRR